MEQKILLNFILLLLFYWFEKNMKFQVSLAQIRVLMIRRVTVTNGSIITIYSTILLSFITCIVMTFVNVPNFLTFQVCFLSFSFSNFRIIFDNWYHSIAESQINNFGRNF